MRVYAIRHKPTGWYLPDYGRWKGVTKYEPTAGARPKLYHTKHGAKCALKFWSRGKFSYRTDDYASEEFPETYIDIVAVPSRKIEQMEVVEFELVELTGEVE